MGRTCGEAGRKTGEWRRARASEKEHLPQRKGLIAQGQKTLFQGGDRLDRRASGPGAAGAPALRAEAVATSFKWVWAACSSSGMSYVFPSHGLWRLSQVLCCSGSLYVPLGVIIMGEGGEG